MARDRTAPLLDDSTFGTQAGLRTWLRRIATRACLDAQRRERGRRTLPSALGQRDPGEVLWLEPLPDHLLADVETDPASAYEMRESVSLAILTALQELPPRQRAVLQLRDVRGVTTQANGGPAVALYQRDGSRYRFTGLQLIGVDAGAIARVTAYMDPTLAPRFHLVSDLPALTATTPTDDFGAVSDGTAPRQSLPFSAGESASGAPEPRHTRSPGDHGA